MVSQSGVTDVALGQMFVKCSSNVRQMFVKSCQISPRGGSGPLSNTSNAVKPVKPVKLFEPRMSRPCKSRYFSPKLLGTLRDEQAELVT